MTRSTFYKTWTKRIFELRKMKVDAFLYWGIIIMNHFTPHLRRLACGFNQWKSPHKNGLKRGSIL